MAPFWNLLPPMPNLSIKNVPEEVVERLRARARANHRSLQGELLELACRAVDLTEPGTTPDRHLRGKAGGPKTVDKTIKKTIEQILAEHKARRKTPVEDAPRAAELIRKERDAR